MQHEEYMHDVSGSIGDTSNNNSFIENRQAEPSPYATSTKEACSEISFSFAEDYCVCFADIIDSTRTAVLLTSSAKVRKFYSTFINTLSGIVKSYNAQVIKNTGDCLIYYFPATSNPADRQAFRDVVDCGFAVIGARCGINAELQRAGLPPLSYRVSADYGRVEVGRSTSSNAEDLFGSTMNLCSKMNSLAAPNTMVIGGDLREVMSSFSFHDCFFEDVGGYSTGLKEKYPVYVVGRRKGRLDILPRAEAMPRIARKTSSSISNNNNNNYNDDDYDKKKNNNNGAKFSVRQPNGDLHGPPIACCVGSNNNNNNDNDASGGSGAISYGSSGSASRGDKKRIMVVDDEPDVLRTFTQFLAHAGYDAEAFADPSSALRHFEECKSLSYCLVIVDIRMPQINGLQLYQRLKSVDAGVKAIFVSALDAARELVTLLPEVRPSCVLKKPVAREQFVEAVRSALA